MNRHPLFLSLLWTCAAGWATAAQSVAPDPVPSDGLHFGSVTMYSENDAYFAGTDDHYTNGFKLSILSTDLRSFTADPVPRPVQKFARLLGQAAEPGAAYKLGFSLGQNIYTPTEIHTPSPSPADRPYSAWLYVGVCFQNYLPPSTGGNSIDAPRLDTFEITLGTVGPNAIGEEIQNGWHNIINVPHAEGWSKQIHNEPGLNLIFQRKHRFFVGETRSGWGADFIPHAGASLGNIFTYADAGAELRAGWQLPDDFGTNLISPSSDSNSRRRHGLSFFVFTGTDGRAVARDITLDGNTFRSSAHVHKYPFVGDIVSGFGLGTRYFQITYAQAERTKEFHGQTSAQVFGSISITAFY